MDDLYLLLPPLHLNFVGERGDERGDLGDKFITTEDDLLSQACSNSSFSTSLLNISIKFNIEFIDDVLID